MRMGRAFGYSGLPQSSPKTDSRVRHTRRPRRLVPLGAPRLTTAAYQATMLMITIVTIVIDARRAPCRDHARPNRSSL